MMGSNNLHINCTHKLMLQVTTQLCKNVDDLHINVLDTKLGDIVF